MYCTVWYLFGTYRVTYCMLLCQVHVSKSGVKIKGRWDERNNQIKLHLGSGGGVGGSPPVSVSGTIPNTKAIHLMVLRGDVVSDVPIFPGPPTRFPLLPNPQSK